MHSTGKNILWHNALICIQFWGIYSCVHLKFFFLFLSFLTYLFSWNNLNNVHISLHDTFNSWRLSGQQINYKSGLIILLWYFYYTQLLSKDNIKSFWLQFWTFSYIFIKSYSAVDGKFSLRYPQPFRSLNIGQENILVYQQKKQFRDTEVFV